MADQFYDFWRKDSPIGGRIWHYLRFNFIKTLFSAVCTRTRAYYLHSNYMKLPFSYRTNKCRALVVYGTYPKGPSEKLLDFFKPILFWFNPDRGPECCIHYAFSYDSVPLMKLLFDKDYYIDKLHNYALSFGAVRCAKHIRNADLLRYTANLSMTAKNLRSND